MSARYACIITSNLKTTMKPSEEEEEEETTAVNVK